MFDFKYAEDVDDAYRKLDVREVQPKGSVIDAQTSDGFIDLSPCVGTYLEAGYFDGYDIDADIRAVFENSKEIGEDLSFLHYEKFEEWSTEQKVLYLTALQTGQFRYWSQVGIPFIDATYCRQIADRLETRVPRDAIVQVRADLAFRHDGHGNVFYARGFCDVLQGDAVIELKFVSELTHTHFLQCAMYMVALNMPRGLLWNVKNDQIFEIRIPDRRSLMRAVGTAITKRNGQCTWLPDGAPSGFGPDIGPEKRTQPDDGRRDAILARLEALSYDDVAVLAECDEDDRSLGTVLKFCHGGLEATAAAIDTFIGMGANREPETVRAVYGSYEKSGRTPPFKARTFFRYFLSYVRATSGPGPSDE